MLQSVKSAWEEYRTTVLHPLSPADQVRETRLAFYCGVQAMFRYTEEIGEPGVSEREAEVFLTSVKAELRAFALEVGVVPRDGR